jgi:hypothetical protein
VGPDKRRALNDRAGVVQSLIRRSWNLLQVSRGTTNEIALTRRPKTTELALEQA